MKKLYPEIFWEVDINWSKPHLYENFLLNGSEYDESAFIYKITGRYSGKAHKLFYIGKTYHQYIITRLNQEDHKKHFKKLSKEYPKHKLYVSLGIIEMEEGNIPFLPILMRQKIVFNLS